MNIDLISYSIGHLVGSIITAIVIFSVFIIRLIGDKNDT
jgi:hypothetical protein